ncbi:universal stress protein [Kitasatospora sp. NPDC088134]|uniref:universal stress protein n=1 Tax=Kitasatospora sp. NPDC088134 TaxID=3364071 RepID=UPI003829FB75
MMQPTTQPTVPGATREALPGTAPQTAPETVPETGPGALPETAQETAPGIVAGYDGSAQSRAAVEWAAAEAGRRGAELTVFRAWPWLGLNDPEAEESLDPAHSAELAELESLAVDLTSRHPSLVVFTRTGAGDPADALVAVAEHYDLVVLGSHGPGGLSGMLAGSVALAVAARAGRPVVLVREGTAPTPAGAPEVVVGLAGEESAAAVDFALEGAGRLGGRVRAVHGWDMVPLWSAVPGWVPPITDTEVQDTALREELSRVTAGLAAAHPDVELTVETALGGAGRAVLEAADSAALVVVGRPGHHLGPVAHAAVKHCLAPVAIVPHGA